jgi:pyruvate/2-oxoacid:ferredoxin oxidoreductase alpha subunit
MSRTLATGNHVAGYALALAGEANRSARGCCAGAYPITPQTEIIEYLSGFTFSRGRVVLVESEHSAMGVCIGGALAGARTFTASSSNGLAYMTENIFATGYYRLPTVMIAVNRTLGPPWNIWVDQGDSLMLRVAAWLQLYCDSHQDLVDTILVAFRITVKPPSDRCRTPSRFSSGSVAFSVRDNLTSMSGMPAFGVSATINPSPKVGR